MTSSNISNHLLSIVIFPALSPFAERERERERERDSAQNRLLRVSFLKACIPRIEKKYGVFIFRPAWNVLSLKMSKRSRLRE